jgi:hypothetical protein
MTYSSEVMSDADQRVAGFPELRDSGGRPIAAYMWTVDRATGSYLVESNHRDRDNPHESRFVFGWNDKQFRFNAIAETSGDVSSGLMWSWKLTWESDLPPQSSPERIAVLAELKAALAAHSSAVHPVKEVNFAF